MGSVVYPISKIDFKLLKAQKIVLLETSCLKVLSKTKRDALDGIINLIDSIQDHAVDELGFDPKEVFNLSDEKGNPGMSYAEAKEIIDNEGK